MQNRRNLHLQREKSSRRNNSKLRQLLYSMSGPIKLAQQRAVLGHRWHAPLYIHIILIHSMRHLSSLASNNSIESREVEAAGGGIQASSVI